MITVAVAGKARHAPMWRSLRTCGVLLISKWIDWPDLLNLLRAKDALAALGPPIKRPRRIAVRRGQNTSSATSQ
jgi:hypothetical protein